MATKRTGFGAFTELAKTTEKFRRGIGLFLESIGRPILWLLLKLFFVLSRFLKLFLEFKKFLFRSPLKRTVKKRKNKQSTLKTTGKQLFRSGRWLSLLLNLFFGLAVITYLTVLKDLPHPDRLITRPQAVSTKIYDRRGQLLYKIYRNQNRTLIKIEDIPPFLIQATVAIEDAEFYHHYGFSLKGISRSLIKNFSQGKLQGGSTITQQLVKNALLSPEKTILRKFRELFLSIQTELRFNKKEILQMYFNEVAYGGAAYGIEEAAWKYFNKSALNLNLPEAALLAGLPASPTLYSPFGAYPDLAKKRQSLVLERMASEKFITPEEAEKAKIAPLSFAPQETNIKAPHFVMFAKDLLAKKFGGQIVEEGGLEVITSLDLAVQNLAQNIVQEELKNLEKLNVQNGAVLVTKPKTGEILAMVGSRNYFATDQDGNVNVTLCARQPGSAIKPINYAVALKMGYTPATILSDTPITYKIPGQPPYSPKNYDNRFHGQVPLRTALASSYNVPAVKILSSYGVEKMISLGQDLGISTWNNPNRFGLALTLGGGEVRMIDLAVVYATFANLGQRVDLQPFLSIENYQGKIYHDFDCGRHSNEFPKGTAAEAFSSSGCSSKTALDPEVAYLLNHILSDNEARTPAFGPHSQLVIPEKTVAVKTGTTNELRDNWTIGYTPDFLVAVWVGNNDNSPMHRIASGLTGASSIWHKIMINLLNDLPDQPFPRPEGIIQKEICSLTGTLPCQDCPTKEEIFISGTEPKNHCSSREEKRSEKEREKILGTEDNFQEIKPATTSYRIEKNGKVIWEKIRK